VPISQKLIVIPTSVMDSGGYFLRSNISFNMSVRSSMAVSIRSSTISDRVAAALALRGTAPVCPEAAAKALASHPFFKSRPVVAPAPRFGRLGGVSGGGGAGSGDGDRFGSFRGAPRSHPTTSEDGFTTVVGGGRRRGGGGVQSAAVAPAPVVTSTVADKDVVHEPAVVKFSSAALRAGVDVEDRMLVRVKGKINRLGHGTYDATKVFMQQILTSDDTDFLDELMKFIFNKASSESTYCALYAKLLHELGDEFPHFRIVINTIFNDYINVFKMVDAGTEPDPGSADYKAFVEAQERKRARRGYSQFVAELVKLGEADVGAFSRLLDTIAGVIEANYTIADKTLMCEEYIDCLSTMCNSAAIIMRSADWSPALVKRMSVLASKPKAASSGLSNKARFAIMDLCDAAGKGWPSCA
jgi:hypothetical protein